MHLTGELYGIIKLDAKVIVDVLGNTKYVNNIIYLILDDYRLLVTRFYRIQFKHCFRAANQCANSLASMGISNNLDLTYFDGPPMNLVSVFENDFNDMYFNRLSPRPIVDL